MSVNIPGAANLVGRAWRAPRGLGGRILKPVGLSAGRRVVNTIPHLCSS